MFTLIFTAASASDWCSQVVSGRVVEIHLIIVCQFNNVQAIRMVAIAILVHSIDIRIPVFGVLRR